jgi:hypothetical protein
MDGLMDFKALALQQKIWKRRRGGTRSSLLSHVERRNKMWNFYSSDYVT